MSSKKKEQRKAKEQARWEREDKEIKSFRLKAPYMKTLLRGRGCDLPFYDFLDSYSEEFKRIADFAKQKSPSLLGIHEVDDQMYFDPTNCWEKLGYGQLEQIYFEIGEGFSDYGKGGIDLNVCGSMIACHDAEERMRTLILIRRKVKIQKQHSEYKYAFKIVALLHELGHVHDVENSINMNAATKKSDLVESEVFAHLYCLEHLSRRGLVESFKMLVGGLQDAIPKGGYLTEVAQRVLERLPEYPLRTWHGVLDEPPTEDELKKLGPAGIAALKAD